MPLGDLLTIVRSVCSFQLGVLSTNHLTKVVYKWTTTSHLFTSRLQVVYLWVEIEHAYLAGVDDGSDGLDAGAVQVLFVFAILDELVVFDVLLEDDPLHKVIVLPVNLVVLLLPCCV